MQQIFFHPCKLLHLYINTFIVDYLFQLKNLYKKNYATVYFNDKNIIVSKGKKSTEKTLNNFINITLFSFHLNNFLR